MCVCGTVLIACLGQDIREVWNTSQCVNAAGHMEAAAVMLFVWTVTDREQPAQVHFMFGKYIYNPLFSYSLPFLCPALFIFIFFLSDPTFISVPHLLSPSSSVLPSLLSSCPLSSHPFSFPHLLFCHLLPSPLPLFCTSSTLVCLPSSSALIALTFPSVFSSPLFSSPPLLSYLSPFSPPV